MSRPASIPSRRMLALSTAFLAGFALPATAATQARVSENYGKLPLHFEANRGQTDNAVHFLSRGPGYSLYLTAREAVLVLAKPDAIGDGRATRERRNTPTRAQSVALRMSLVGAARKPAMSGLDEQPGKANYFIGNDPAKWRTNVPTYAKVHYRNVYPGIDLVYYGNRRQLEHDFIVSPGADPNKIVLDFRGAEKLEIDAEGNLVLRTAAGVVLQRKPVIYQEIAGVRTEIAGGYTLRGARRAGFKLAAYDTTRPLVIDPILLYSTFLGGNGNDTGTGIAADADGNAYVIGNTSSTDFPTTAGTFQTSPSTCSLTPTVFVTKLNATGSAVVYSSYLGGCNDLGGAIAVDAAGNAYLTGTTRSFSFPTTTGAFQRSTAGASVFVTKISATGSELVYSTFLGGRSDDTGAGIAVDSAGNAYVAGWTQSIDFPTTAGAFQPVYSGDGGEAAFATKLNPEGSALVYSTYLTGGSAHDRAAGIAVDADGNAYVVGSSSPFVGTPATFPTTAGAFQPSFGGGFADAFVAKLDATGSALVYSTFLGGSQSEGASSIVVDTVGNAYVSGGTSSSDFPTTAGAFQTVRRGNSDAFVTKLNPAGSALVYSTFLGGGGDDGGNIAVDADGNAYVAGGTTSTDFPTTAGAFQARLAGAENAFVAKLDPTGSALSYSTYLGGSVGDSGTSIVVDTHGNAYVTGMAESSDFPTTSGAFQTNHGSGFDRVGNPRPDAFVAKFVSSARFEESDATVAYAGSWTAYGAETGAFSGGTMVASNALGSGATFSFMGTAVSWIGVRCNVCGIAAVSIDGGTPSVVNLTGSGTPGSLKSEVVFTALGLARGVNHTMAITVTGAGAAVPGFLTGSALVAVDAFDVAR